MRNYNAELKNRDLKKAVDFHGHLGPYLILGIKIGNLAIKKLNAKKHFGIKAIVSGAVKKPKSCLVDGIQVSTGCTYGKGNIQKRNGSRINVKFQNINTNRIISFTIKENVMRRLNGLKGHRDSEQFAKELLGINPIHLFKADF